MATDKKTIKSSIRTVGKKDSGKGSFSYFITLPKKIVKELGWSEGVKLIVKKSRGSKKLSIENLNE